MRDRIFSKDCQKIIEMSEPEKGQRSVYQESDLLTKGSLRNKVINYLQIYNCKQELKR